MHTVWADTAGSIPAAAAALVCHPNTVRNRLHRIEESTGRSLTSPRDPAELCLAFETAATRADQPGTLPASGSGPNTNRRPLTCVGVIRT